MQPRWLYGAFGVLAIGAVVAWWIAYPHVTAVVMTTGTRDSAYDVFAHRYQDILARAGVDLRLMPSAGSVENLRRLNDPQSGVAVGFSQGGLTDAKQSADLVSLGTVFYEPFWFFCRGTGCGSRPETLRSGKISFGPEGSGTRVLCMRLFALNGLDPSTADIRSLNAAESAEALMRGDIDAAAMAASWDTPAVRKLLAAADIELISFARANAYVALYPYLSKLLVPAGVGSLADNLPRTDVSLLAVKASLIVRRDMDTALQSVLLDAATQVHSGADIFQHAGQFPAPEAGDFPVSEDAYEFYKSGRPFLLRYLPFGLAMLARKLLVVLVPLLGVVYPVVRFAPMLYGWSMRRRVYRLYGELKLIEADVDAHRGEPAALLQRLDRLDERADHLQVPLAFVQILYNMRSHIGLARARLQPGAAQRKPPSS